MSSAPHNPMSCLSDNDLAAYLDGGLDRPARQRVEAHLATCSECRSLAASAIETLVDIPGEAPLVPQPATRSRRWLPIAAGFLAAAALAVFVLRPASSGVAALAQASNGYRFAEGRLTGGFGWAPLADTTVRGATDVARSADITIAVGEIEKSLASDRNAEHLAAYGVSRLALLKPTEAIDALLEATRTSPSSANYWSDLSAAYLARSREAGRDADLPSALDAADRALKLQPALPEALFNKAVLSERLGLKEQAIEAWTRYLALDRSSAWRDEANRALQRLTAPPTGGAGASQTPEALRQSFDTALRRWANSDASASQPFVETMREAVAQLETQRAEHRAESGSLALVERASNGAAADARRIVDAHRQYFAARALVNESRYTEAEAPTARALKALGAVASPLEFEAQYLNALIAYRLKDNDRAYALFETLRSSPRVTDYPVLVGRTQWMLGLLDATAGRWSAAAEQYGAADDRFERAQEPGLQQLLLRNVASVHNALGDVSAGWTAIIRPLRMNAPGVGAWLQASRFSSDQAMPFAALAFAVEGQRLAVQQKSAANVADALRIRAGVLASLGDREAAATLIRETELILAQRQEAGWDDVRAEVNALSAQFADQNSLSDGLVSATKAVEYFSKRQSFGRLPELLLIRARLSKGANDLDSARRDVVQGFEHLINSRDKVVSSTSRAAAEVVEHDLSEELASLVTDDSSAASAFALIDATRGRDVVKDAHTRATLESLGAELPDGRALVTFVVADQASYAWIVGQKAQAFKKIALPRARLADLITAANPPRSDAAAQAALAEHLLAPVRDVVPALRELVVVPDGPLRELALAVVVAQHGSAGPSAPSLVVVPSVAAWSAATRQLASARTAGTAVAIGNPSLDTSSGADLANLPEAELEAKDAAAFYTHPSVITGAAATPVALTTALRKVDVVHFAGHAVQVPTVLDGSYLALAGGREGRVTAASIRSQQGLTTRLVVLAGCETAARDARGVAAPLSLSRAFLAAGVPSVVGTLWPIGDRASRALFAEFHRQFAQSGDAAWSLSRAQEWMQRSGDPVLASPQSWAGVVVLGGSARRAS